MRTAAAARSREKSERKVSKKESKSECMRKSVRDSERVRKRCGETVIKEKSHDMILRMQIWQGSIPTENA